MIVRFTLQWPNKLLSPNVKEPWKGNVIGFRRMVAQAKKRANWEGRMETLIAINGCSPFQTDNLKIRFTFCPPSRRIDRANMPHMVKHHTDGIAEMLEINDRKFMPEYVFAEPAPPHGRVEVEIGESVND